VFDKGNYTFPEWNEHLSDYPFSTKDFKKAYSPGPLSNCGFAQLVARLEAGEEVRLAVYGGSVSRGHDCIANERVSDESLLCAWPHRLQLWFRLQFPHWKLVVDNYSKGGWGSGLFNSLPIVNVADGYLIENCVNKSPALATQKLLDKLQGPKLFVCLPVGCGPAKSGCNNRCDSDEQFLKTPGMFLCMNDFNRRQRLDAFRANWTVINVEEVMWPKMLHPRADFGQIYGIGSGVGELLCELFVDQYNQGVVCHS
jgi:hypothetical protein